jgi:hypothetical protein
MFSPQQRRHPEAPRFLQRGEGSREGRQRAVASCRMLHARSLARPKNAGLRDDALNDYACDARSR